MCEPGTDKCTCPDCPGTCQGQKKNVVIVVLDELRRVINEEFDNPSDYIVNVPILEAIGKAEGKLLAEFQLLEDRLSESQAEVGRLREALEKSKGLFILGDLYRRYTGQLQPNKAKGFQEKADIIHGEIRKALSSPSPATDKWKAMERVVDVAKHIKRVGGVISAAVMQELEESVDDLKALEKAGGE